MECSLLRDLGLSVELLCADVAPVEGGHLDWRGNDDEKLFAGFRWAKRLPQWKQWLEFHAAINRSCKGDSVQLIHDHGLWLPSNLSSWSVARRMGIPLVVSTHGMLSPAALRWKGAVKSAALFLYQRRILNGAAAIRASSCLESKHLRDFGYRGPIANVPYGVERPAAAGDRPSLRGRATRSVLYLGRLHPLKGIETLLRAWGRVRPRGWELLLAGADDDGYRVSVESMLRTHGLESSVRLLGPVGDDGKWPLLASADLFVLPSVTESFGVVVAEALASGTPVIATRGTPWRELEEARCGWWVNATEEGLAEALRDATSQSDAERSRMGRIGQDLISERYAPREVIKGMVSVYHWLIHGGSVPARVDLMCESPSHVG